jgi:hypothetical protein
MPLQALSAALERNVAFESTATPAGSVASLPLRPTSERPDAICWRGVLTAEQAEAMHDRILSAPVQRVACSLALHEVAWYLDTATGCRLPRFSLVGVELLGEQEAIRCR